MELHAVKTWYDQREGVVTVEDDVVGVIRDIRAIDPRIHVYYNEQTSQFDLVEHCLDDTERLIFSVAELDARVITRLRAGDSWRDGNPNHVVPEADDFLAQIEAAQEQLDREKDERASDRLRDAGERMARELGIGHGPKGSISVSKEVKSDG